MRGLIYNGAALDLRKRNRARGATQRQAAAQQADAASEAPAQNTIDDSGEEISMEEVLGAGTRRKEVASEDNAGVPEVETQAY